MNIPSTPAMPVAAAPPLDPPADDHAADAVEMAEDAGLKRHSIIRAVEPATGEPVLDFPKGSGNHVRWVGLRLGNVGKQPRHEKFNGKNLRFKLRSMIFRVLVGVHLKSPPSAAGMYAAYHKWALDDGARQDSTAAGPRVWGRIERAPIWAFRLFTWALTVGSFTLVGALIGGWPTAGGAALLSGVMSLPYLLGIKRRP